MASTSSRSPARRAWSSWGTARSRPTTCRPTSWACEPAGDGAVAAGTPDQNARVLRDVLAGEPGTERSLAVLNAAAAIYVGGRADSLAAGVRAGRGSRSTRAPRAACSRATWSTPGERPAGRAGRRHARGGAPAQARAPARRARGGGGVGARGPAVRRGAVAAGHVADRRAQAALAVGRDDPRGGQLRRGGAAPTSAAARRRCRC